MFKTHTRRLFIFAKDIELLTGRKERTARRYLANIRKDLGKRSTAPVTIREFCAYTGLSETEVREHLPLRRAIVMPAHKKAVALLPRLYTRIVSRIRK